MTWTAAVPLRRPWGTAPKDQLQALALARTTRRCRPLLSSVGLVHRCRPSSVGDMTAMSTSLLTVRITPIIARSCK